MANAPVRLGGEPPRTAAARRWRKWRWPLVVAGVVAFTGLLAALIQPELSDDPLAADNPRPEGVRALMQVLGDQGVQVTETRSLEEAVAAAEAGSTLAVVETYLLWDNELDELAETRADLVLIDPEDFALEVLTDATVAVSWSGGSGVRYAECDDPDAVAADRLAGADYTVTAVGEATACFGFTSDPAGTGAYVVTSQNGRPVRILADSTPLTNARVTEAGNAALALRVLGKNDRLTWYRPSYEVGLVDAGGPGIGDLLPAVSGPLTAWLALVVLVVALWRARAFGRVVSEPLPVTVRAAETTRGRGRLYRRARSRGHAAAALRAGTARRAAARLGLPRSAGAESVLTALAGATGRPTDQLAALLYGPPPNDDLELAALARALDQLESEVHHP